jgi:hypothetical protein
MLLIDGTFSFATPFCACIFNKHSNALHFILEPGEGSLIENAVVIVGNNRAAGWVKESIAKIVGQDEADFTCTTKFPE